MDDLVPSIWFLVAFNRFLLTARSIYGLNAPNQIILAIIKPHHENAGESFINIEIIIEKGKAKFVIFQTVIQLRREGKLSLLMLQACRQLVY